MGVRLEIVGHGAKIARKREDAIAALLTQPTVAAAAGVAGIGEKTLRRWLQDSSSGCLPGGALGSFRKGGGACAASRRPGDLGIDRGHGRPESGHPDAGRAGSVEDRARDILHRGSGKPVEHVGGMSRHKTRRLKTTAMANVEKRLQQLELWFGMGRRHGSISSLNNA